MWTGVRMTRRTITAKATATLEGWLEQFMGGDLHFGDLPLAVEAYLHVGYSLGRASRQLEIEQLERAANRLHNLAFETDKDRRARLEARLSQALEVATEEQWDRIEAELYEALADRQLNTNSIGADITPAVAQRRPHDGSTQARGKRAA